MLLLLLLLLPRLSSVKRWNCRLVNSDSGSRRSVDSSGVAPDSK